MPAKAIPWLCDHLSPTRRIKKPPALTVTPSERPAKPLSGRLVRPASSVTYLSSLNIRCAGQPWAGGRNACGVGECALAEYSKSLGCGVGQCALTYQGAT